MFELRLSPVEVRSWSWRDVWEAHAALDLRAAMIETERRKREER